MLNGLMINCKTLTTEQAKKTMLQLAFETDFSNFIYLCRLSKSMLYIR